MLRFLIRNYDIMLGLYGVKNSKKGESFFFFFFDFPVLCTPKSPFLTLYGEIICPKWSKIGWSSLSGIIGHTKPLKTTINHTNSVRWHVSRHFWLLLQLRFPRPWPVTEHRGVFLRDPSRGLQIPLKDPLGNPSGFSYGCYENKNLATGSSRTI